MELKDKSEMRNSVKMEKEKAKEHIGTLKTLQAKDPEFYEFLKEHDNELLDFDEEDLDDDLPIDAEEEEEVDNDVDERSVHEAATEEELDAAVETGRGGITIAVGNTHRTTQRNSRLDGRCKVDGGVGVYRAILPL